jgi:hypothetical protein
VGLAGVAGSVALASLGAASFSAAAPPEAPEVAASLGVDAVLSLLSLAGVSLLVEELSVALLVVLVDVVAVDVVCAAVASALVLVGGVISGVLFGTASETLAPPQALSATPDSSVAHAASAARRLTTGPCACRM